MGGDELVLIFVALISLVPFSMFLRRSALASSCTASI